MAKSLNPNATTSPGAKPDTMAPPHGEPPRRNLLVGALAAAIGGFVGLFPLGSGLALFLNPLLKKKAAAKEGSDNLKRVATIDSIPIDGTPIQVPVIADKIDAWTGEPNQPVGAVFIRRVEDGVECVNAICPHAGCMVAFSADRKQFLCPCHTSAFEIDGKRIMPSPSPRDMDLQVVDKSKLESTGEVWIDFVNYYPGKEHQEPKA